jgi:predicted outer membrane repeat protein
MRVLIYRLCVLFLLFIAPFIISVRPASAHGVVGTGSPDTCTEAALDIVLTGGGVVTFNCGGNPFTLALTRARTIDQSITIDGGGRITITGNGTFRLFDVKAPVFEIKNLTLTGGNAGNDGGGAIRAFNTKLLVISSTLIGNTAAYGGAIACTACQASLVENSTLTQNQTTKPGDGQQFSLTGGGAIHLYSGSHMTINGSTFADNATLGSGGGLANYGSTTRINRSTFTNNRADYSGGAIKNSRGNLIIWDSKLLGNVSTKYGGGAIDSYRYTVQIRRSTLANNRAESGGAIAMGMGRLEIVDSTFSGNTATKYGGAIEFSQSGLAISNSTISGNTAQEGSAIGAYAAGVGLTNTTIAGNIATKPNGGAITGSPILAFRNTIIANNAGGNCRTNGRITDGGGNLQFPESTCGSIPSLDPLLDPAGLKDNGGSTQTIGLQPNSPAIRLGSSGCMQFDQRGVKRPDPCSSGAFEPS